MRALPLAAVATLCMAFLPLALALEIGDKAPRLQVAQWLNRSAEDPSQPDGKTVYAVLFCLTWQADGMAALNHLDNLQKAHQNQGLRCVAILREEAAKIKGLAESRAWRCAIGLDAGDTTHHAYGADRIDDLPLAFIIDKAGTVVWRGHPLPALARIAAKTLAGTLALQQAKDIAAAQAALEEARRGGSADAMQEANARLLRLEPDAAEIHALRAQIFIQGDQPEKAAEALAAWRKGCAASPAGLAMLTLFILNQPDLGRRDPQLALAAAQEAYALPGGKKEPLVFIALARIYAECGWLERAAAILQEGIADMIGVEAEDAAALLAYYRRIIDVRNDAVSKGQKP